MAQETTLDERRETVRVGVLGSPALGAVLSAVAGILAAGLMFGDSERTIAISVMAAVVGLYFGLLAWLFWAIGRALAPDEPIAAVLALLLGGPAAVFSGISLIEVVLVLLLVKQLHRQQGPAIDWRIAAPILVLTLLGSAGLAGWPVGLAAALAFLLDARLSKGPRARASLLFGFCTAALTVLLALTGPIEGVQGLFETPAFTAVDAKPIGAWLGVLATVGAGAALVLGQQPVVWGGGPNQPPIAQDRARAGLVVALLFVAGPLFGRWEATLHAVPIAGVLTAVAIGRALPFGRVRAVAA